MAYSARDAKNTFFEYINRDEHDTHFIEGTSNRGLILTLPTGEDCVVFLYPISHKTDDSKNFFDTRDSGAKERMIAWQYAINHNLKYFCFAVHDQVERYKNYIFSLECDENIIAEVSGTLNGKRSGSGTQVVIPNDFAPNKQIERIKTKNGFFITAIAKEQIFEYMQIFDNRPYMCMSAFAKNTIIISESINKPHQRIFFGAPGTGKSYELNEEAKEYFGNNYERVTFHPNYMYGNFVGAFKPFPKVLQNSDGSIKKDEDGNIQEKITYEYIPGVLMKQLVKALKNENENYLLLIEEINRANVAAVFGDIFQLLDRAGNGQSEYVISTSKELQEFLKKEFDGCELSENVKQNLGDSYSRLYLPSNLYIWATMNSADQGVMPMDTAFRRRWEFRYLGIDEAADSNKEKFNTYKFKINAAEIVNWDEFRRELNRKLSNLNIPEDKLIGPYFISKSVLEGADLDKLTETIKNKVLMYLYEDAAKAYKPLLFAEGKYSTYSTVCKYFDENALNLFKGNLDVPTELIAENNVKDEDENNSGE